jgi:hypothetical protein
MAVKTLILLSALVVVCIATALGQKGARTIEPTDEKLTDNDQIRAVVARELLNNWSSHKKQPTKPSIAIESADPSRELLSSLNKDWPMLWPQSKCGISGEDLIALPGERIEICDVRIHIGKLNRLKDGSVETNGYTQTTAGGFGVLGCTYVLTRKKQDWIIKDTYGCSVS